MLTSIRERLDEYCFILASASPRRLKLLEELAGFNGRLKVLPSLFSENLDPAKFEGPAKYAIVTSLEKAREVADRKFSELSSTNIIISADTVVECDGRVLEKPKDAAHSHEMLRFLSGRTHLVHTGVTLGLFDDSLLKKYTGNGKVQTFPFASAAERLLHTVTFSVTTRVNFCELDDDIIAGYVTTGEGLDKAGSYGIQGIGSTLVESIDGDFYNVVGLPLTRLCQEIYLIFRK